MKARYKGILTFIAILIGICIFIGIAYQFYDRVISSDTDVVVEDELSINFINGSKITKDGTYSFSITNNGNNDIYFDIMIDELTNYEEEVRYNLISTEADIHITNASFDDEQNTLVSGVLINAGSTQNFAFKLSKSTLISFKLRIKKVNESIEYFYATVLKNNSSSKMSETKVGEEIAVLNEGLIEDIDDYGITYYFRGKVDNNYVKFGDYIWRIVRINGNGTVKLVLDEAIGDLGSYNDNAEEFESIEKSSITSFLNSFYESYLFNNDQYIVNSKYCSESGKVLSGNNFTYNSYDRLVTNKIPTFNCLGNTYSSKIGLLTADEVVFAGANFAADNKEYYLYNDTFENNWWTSSLATSSSNNFYPISISVDGKLITNVSGTLYRNIRPTISLIRKITVSGDGTINNPYVIS